MERLAHVKKELLTVQETAEIIGVTKMTLSNWRLRNIGPAYYRISTKKLAYSKSAVEQWLESIEVNPNAKKKRTKQKRSVS